MPVTVCCVNAGNYEGRGVQYVNALYRQVARNSRYPIRFICLTDDMEAKGYLFGIELRQLPQVLNVNGSYTNLRGWWNKLSMFRPGLLPSERIVYFDLDTVITGNIDALLQYRGRFGMLRDLMRPAKFGSGIMAWDARRKNGIWDAYIAAGFPQSDAEGDQAFIATVIKEPDLLQNFADGIYSYKVSCKAGLPADARVVCFHGLPRPHQVYDEWVAKHTGDIWLKTA